MILLSLKLLLAHLIGDFLLQPYAWVKDKEAKKHRSLYLYFHLAIHALLLLVVLQFQPTYLAGVLFIIITHGLLDIGKLHASARWKSPWFFLLDQVGHLTVIALVVNYYHPLPLSALQPSAHTLALLLCLVLLTGVASICITVMMSRWQPRSAPNPSGLPQAGTWIGILERLFVFGFVIGGYWQAIGFLLATKSIFRFGDLSRSQDRELTEYILIGTLLSFGWGIAVGQLYLYLQHIL